MILPPAPEEDPEIVSPRIGKAFDSGRTVFGP